MKTFDAIVVGAGQAGPFLAVRLAEAGRRVLLVERNLLGGTCVNTGCMPTKTLVASARAAHVVRRAADFGVTIEGAVSVDMKRVRARALQVIENARGSLTSWITHTDRLTFVRGHARFESANTIRVGEDLFGSPEIFLNVGARPKIPSVPGRGRVPFLTSASILDLDEVPGHLVVLGGSYIGIEYAQMYRRFGAEVTIVERGPKLAPREDDDVSAAIREILEREGVRVVLGAEAVVFEPGEPRGSRETVQVRLGAEPPVHATHVLVAVGREPNTSDLGLERAGVAVDERGYVVVDDHLRTNVPGIWAMGDANGRGAFTHTSYNEFEVVAANLLDGDRERSLVERVETYALYMDPPLARAGLTKAAARRAGKKLLVGHRPMQRVGRAVERDETSGFLEILVDADSKRILGAALLGIEADEAIHRIIDAMHADQPYTVLQRSMGIHPTVSELLPTVLGDLRPA